MQQDGSSATSETDSGNLLSPEEEEMMKTVSSAHLNDLRRRCDLYSTSSHYAKKWFAIEVTKLINSGLLTYDKLKEDVEAIYGCEQNESQLYKKIIDDELSRIFKAFVTNTSTDILISELIKNANSRHKGPMTNLRDVDVALEINLRGE